MRRRTPDDPQALVVRFGWRRRAWPTLVLAAAALALGLSLLLDRSYSFWNDAGALGLIVLFTVLLAAWAGQARPGVGPPITRPGWSGWWPLAGLGREAAAGRERRDEVVVEGEDDRGGPVAQLQLGEQVVDVCLDRSLTDK
jgi:hypothetical protein